MFKLNDNMISPKEILQDHFTDFDILREKPLVFKAGDCHLVAAPIMWKEHPEFIVDLGKILSRNLDLFQNVEFLSASVMRDQSAITKLISQVRVFQATRQYKKFILKDMPKFIMRWAWTIDGNEDEEKFIPLNDNKKKAVKILDAFHVDELLYVLFAIFCFNYDLVKQNTLDFISRLSVGGTGQALQTSSASSTKTVCQMPKYSAKPYPKSTLELFERQSTGREN